MIFKHLPVCEISSIAWVGCVAFQASDVQVSFLQMRLAVLKLNRTPAALLEALFDSDVCQSAWAELAEQGILFPWGKLVRYDTTGRSNGCWFFASKESVLQCAAIQDLWEYVGDLGALISAKFG